MQTDVAIVDQVRELIASTLDLDEHEVTDDISPATCSQWSSLYHLTLLLALEERFGISFSMDEMPEMTSLPRIVTSIERHCVRATP